MWKRWTTHGWDRVVQRAKLRVRGGHIERPVNHLYPLELSCNQMPLTPKDQLNPKAPEFRSTCDAAVAVRVRIHDIQMTSMLTEH